MFIIRVKDTVLANKRKDKLREKIRELKKKDKTLTYKQIAEEVGLRDRQWVYYYLKHD